MENKKQKQKRKNPTRSAKNIMKCLVKEAQRMHLYKTPFHVKFWNSILREARIKVHGGKVRNDLILSIVDRYNEYFDRMLVEETDSEKWAIIKRKKEIIQPFVERDFTKLVYNDGDLISRTVQSECVKYNIFTEEEYSNLPPFKKKCN